MIIKIPVTLTKTSLSLLSSSSSFMIINIIIVAISSFLVMPVGVGGLKLIDGNAISPLATNRDCWVLIRSNILL